MAQKRASHSKGASHARQQGRRPQVHRRFQQIRSRADPVLLDRRHPLDGLWRLPLEGKEAYDAEIENPAFSGSPSISITRMVEEDDVVMAEMTLEVQRAAGETMRAAMGEVFVFRGGQIEERRAYVIELEENDYK